MHRGGSWWVPANSSWWVVGSLVGGVALAGAGSSDVNGQARSNERTAKAGFNLKGTNEG